MQALSQLSYGPDPCSRRREALRGKIRFWERRTLAGAPIRFKRG